MSKSTQSTASETRVVIRVCPDCLDAIEFTDDNLGYPDGTLSRHIAVMKRHCVGLDLAEPIHAVNPEEFTEFSWARCEGCGTGMAGARYNYSVVEVPDA